MEDLPEFIDDSQAGGAPSGPGSGASRRVAMVAGTRQMSVEVHWPGPDGGFGTAALRGLYLAAPDPRRQRPVCQVPMQDERVRGSLRGDVYVVQDTPERLDYLLWVAVPAWRVTDDQARLVPAGVIRHEATVEVLKGPWPAGSPETRAIATAALISAHAIQRMARQGPAAAEGWVVAEAWPRGINLQDVLLAARENRPVAVGVLSGG